MINHTTIASALLAVMIAALILTCMREKQPSANPRTMLSNDGELLQIADAEAGERRWKLDLSRSRRSLQIQTAGTENPTRSPGFSVLSVTLIEPDGTRISRSIEETIESWEVPRFLRQP